MQRKYMIDEAVKFLGLALTLRVAILGRKQCHLSSSADLPARELIRLAV
jgi:hypothetical protein